MLTDLERFEICISKLRENPNVLDKINISQTYDQIGTGVKGSVFFSNSEQEILLGDDTAAILQEDGTYLLMASEGIITYFLEKDPWFAGYSAIMVNISDICAMGGLPMAITDTLYIKNAKDATKIWEGMLAASNAYGVPIVGGHTCYHSNHKALSVSILGKATKHLLTSFHAKEGECILLAIDLNGVYYKDYSFWNASTSSVPDDLRKQIKVLNTLANKGLTNCAKDVSMGGIIGTLWMLMNSSKIGVEIEVEKIPKPVNVIWSKWLSSFPSYGYLITCKKEHISEIKKEFKTNNIACEAIGHVTKEKKMLLNYKNRKIKF